MRDRSRLVWEGLIAGLLGYAVVVVFYGVWNVALGRSPFHTAEVLGTALFFRDVEAGAAVNAAGAVLAYNGLHLTVLVVAGIAAAAVIAALEARPGLFHLIVLLGLAVAILTTLMGIAVTAPQGGELPWWTLTAAHTLAMLAAGAYLWRRHPELRRAISQLDALDEAEAAGLMR
jgi:hypothetical protein